MLSSDHASRDNLPLSLAEIQELLAPLAGQAHLAIAVSGGADSVCLMHLLHQWAGAISPAPRLSVLSVDHGLRAGARAEASQVGRWAAKLGLDHHILTWLGDKPESGLQARARDARYRLMCGWCRDHGAGLVLAHHRQDQAETLLMRAGRGSGPDGLCGMDEASRREGVALLRPLLDLPPQALKTHLQAAGQDWIEDPSNQDRRFERVRVRQQLVQCEQTRQLARRLCRDALALRQVRDAQETKVDELFGKGLTASPGGYCHFDPLLFSAAAETICIRALRRIVLAIGGKAHPPRRTSLEGIMARMIHQGAAGATLVGCRVMRRRGRIWAVREQRGLAADAHLQDGESAIWDNRFAVRARSKPDAELHVRALGVGGWAEIRGRQGEKLTALPAPAGQSLPGVYQGDKLLAAPCCGLGNEGFEAEFIQMWRLQP